MKRALLITTSLLWATSAAPTPAADVAVVNAFIDPIAQSSMKELIPLYERSHPGTVIEVTSAAATVIAEEVESGSSVDLIMVDGATVTALHDNGKVGTPVGIVGSGEAVLVPKGSTTVHGLRDLANPGVRVVLGTPESQQGRYARTVLVKASGQFGAEFERKVMANVVTTKTALNQIPAAVKGGVADAGIGFSADAPDGIYVIPVPVEDDVFTTSFAAVVLSSRQADVTQDFIAFLRGPSAQGIFRKHHFDAPR